ncbi:MAG: glutamyl-tRNA reductase [Flavobacteriaceae bacterium]|nr:glutamyl-tRNA reductase [Flavobacteriaceae bacterium]
MVGLISINYKIAPLNIRERLFFDNSEKLVFHNHLRKELDIEGLMIISTCNRTEIYFEFENHIGQENKFLHSVVKELVVFKKYKDSLSPHLNNLTGSYKVANHLFRLVSGLESMIIGEFQIVEQLKDAYYFSKKHKMLGPILGRMIQKSLETGKYIRTNTEIGRGAVSVSYAAVEQITNNYDLKNAKFLCVGLGETSKLSIRHLHQKGIKKIKITNRTKSKLNAFCKELGYESILFTDYKKEILNCDVVIFSTSSKSPLLTKKDIEQKIKKRKNKLLLVDLSVPRNLSHDLEEVNNIEIINIDNLKDTVNENYKKRKAEVIKAELYIEEFLVEFDDWTNTRLLRPSILSLKKQVRELFLKETISNIKSLSQNATSKDLSLKLSKAYDKFSDNLVKKIKKASDNGKDEKAIEIINQIFLDEK